MRVVVMDEDMREPITVVEIPMWLMREVQDGKRRYVTLAAPTRFADWFSMVDQIPNVQETVTVRHVQLRMEPIYKNREILYWTAIPDNPELALLLRAAFLPGQMTELQRRETQAWFHGAVAALRS